MIAKYDICQIRPDGHTNTSMIEKLIYEVRDRHIALSVIEYENLNEEDRTVLIAQVKKECRKNVVGALFQDFNGALYGFDHRENRIWLHLCAYNFLMTYKLEIEQMNYYAWAKFLAHTKNSIGYKTRHVTHASTQLTLAAVIRNLRFLLAVS